MNHLFDVGSIGGKKYEGRSFTKLKQNPKRKARNPKPHYIRNQLKHTPFQSVLFREDVDGSHQEAILILGYGKLGFRA